MRKEYKFILIFIVFFISASYFSQFESPKTFITKLKKFNHKDEKINISKATPSHKETSIKRSLAAVPTKKTTNLIQDKRVYLGKFKDLRDIHLSNKVSDNWEEKYRHNFLRMIPDHKVKDFKVELKRSIVLVKNNIGKHLEHVVVSYTNPEGRPFSFEAHINSQTGQVEQTWNKTHHEFRKPAQISGAKYLYKKDK